MTNDEFQPASVSGYPSHGQYATSTFPLQGNDLFTNQPSPSRPGLFPVYNHHHQNSTEVKPCYETEDIEIPGAGCNPFYYSELTDHTGQEQTEGYHYSEVPPWIQKRWDAGQQHSGKDIIDNLL